MAASEVLDERVPSDHDARRSIGLQAAHRPQPGLEVAVVGLAPIVLVLPGVVERPRDQVLDQVRQGRRARSVMTSAGARCANSDVAKNVRAEAISL